MIKVLVTGATGFIGRHMVKHLRDKGLAVCGISLESGIVSGVEIDQIDLTDSTVFEAWTQGKTFDVIIHLAADIPADFSSGVSVNSFRNNTLVMVNLLEFARREDCRVIYISSSAIYGKSLYSNEHKTEKHLPKPVNYYATSKYVGELLCEQLYRSEGLKYIVLRISAPYGPGNKRNTVLNLFIKAALESRNLALYGTGKRLQDFVFISDITAAIWQAMQSSTVGIYNIASGSPVTMYELAENVLRVIPNSLSRIVYVNEPDAQESYKGLFSIMKASQILKWEPKVDLTEGLRQTAAWLMENV